MEYKNKIDKYVAFTLDTILETVAFFAKLLALVFILLFVFIYLPVKILTFFFELLF